MTNQNATVSYAITNETRKAIHGLIANKPFNAVFGITQVLEKDELTTEEANAIINAIGQFPYAEVAEFFAKVGEYFVQKTNEVTEETKETAEATK